MECEQTMRDNAHIVREALRTAAMIEETYRDALAALDRILAERDEARQANAEKRELLTKTALRISQLEDERDEALKWRHMHDAAAKDWREEVERGEAAEAEVARLNHENGALEAELRSLREAMATIVRDYDDSGEVQIARAALGEDA